MSAFTGVHEMKKKALSTLVCGLVLVGVATAAEQQTRNSSVADTSMNEVNLQLGQQLPSYKQWTQEDALKSESWGMTQTEWLEYKQLMSNSVNASYYSNKPELTPLMVMGINAKTANERTRYARLSVEMEQERLRKEVLFDEAVNAHIKSLIPNHPVWMSDKERRSWAKQNASAGVDSGNAAGQASGVLSSVADTRTVAYVDAQNCNSKCQRFISDLATKSTKLNRLDLFVIGAQNDKALLAFASKVGVSSASLNAAKATVNYDQGYYARLKPAPGLPVAYRVQLNDTVELKP